MATTARGRSAAASSGPIVSDKLSLGVSFAQVDRDGFTVNDVTGNDIDSRSAFSGKAQLLWLPNSAWEGARHLHVASGLATATTRSTTWRRSAPIRSMRRATSKVAPIATCRHDDPGAARQRPGRVLEHHRIPELEDAGRDRPRLHAAPDPDARQHGEGFSVHAGDPLRVGGRPRRSSLADSARLRWQSGVFLFTQSYEQDAINNYAPFVVAPFPVESAHAAVGARRLRARAVRAGARSRSTTGSTSTAGARFDYEDKSALLENFFEPLIAPPARVEADKSFSNVSPQVSVSYRVQPDKTLYGDGWPRLQGRRLQLGVARGQRGVRRGVHLEHRRRREDALGRTAASRRMRPSSTSTGTICS